MAILRLALEHGHAMKTCKSTPSAKGRTFPKVFPKAKGSQSLKASPSAKNSPSTKAKPQTNGVQNPKSSSTRKAKPLQRGTAEPPDDATQPVDHSGDAIRARAYLNYQKRGSEDGNHTDDWLRAEAELTAERHQGRA